MTTEKTLPTTIDPFMSWTWAEIEPFFKELQERLLDASSLHEWLSDWTKLAYLIEEMEARLYVATSQDTADQKAEERFNAFLDEIYQPAKAADQELKKKLLRSGLQPVGLEVALRNIQADNTIFRQENLPLLSELQKLGIAYDRIIGGQTITWEGAERTVSQMEPEFQASERGVREEIWRLVYERRLQDRESINENWAKLLGLRRRVAANAGLPDFRAYQWHHLKRFDYTPEDCLAFHDAIESAVVPAATRVYERLRQRSGVETVRPWDLGLDMAVYNYSYPNLSPFTETDILERTSAEIFRQVDPEFGSYFTTMMVEGLLDLENRKGKAPGGYCIRFPVTRRPFIFMNAVGTHDNVQTMLHEAGHAFHVFEESPLPYHLQHEIGSEFAEVASMSMELLASPYLEADRGGFYSRADAARARIEHLEGGIQFWPYMAVVDAFQHWVYTHGGEAENPANCDACWADLWDRFIPAVDWSGLEESKKTGWQRKLHIHTAPFYYVEYGLALMGANQVWRNSLDDQAAALKSYRHALSLGGTVPLPDLYRAAGARLAFDRGTLTEVVELMERTIHELENGLA
jgi:oligoendopeptidase F